MQNGNIQLNTYPGHTANITTGMQQHITPMELHNFACHSE